MAKTKSRTATPYNKCIGKELKGRHFRSRAEAQSAMKSAAKKCSR